LASRPAGSKGNLRLGLARRRGANVLELYRRIAPKVVSLGARNETVTLAAPFVPQELRATLFANCVDFAASDGLVAAAEQALLEQLAQALALDEAESFNIIQVILIKNQGQPCATEPPPRCWVPGQAHSGQIPGRLYARQLAHSAAPVNLPFNSKEALAGGF
jgi:hypothetical protein